MRFWNYLACRLWRPRDYWHNRHFDGRYRAEEREPGVWSVNWKHAPVPVRPLAELARLPHPPVCHIIASGPSLAAVKDPARLFNDFTICMNGSFRFAQKAGKPCDLFVTFDAGFIRRRFADFKEAVPWSKHMLLDHLMLFLIANQDAKLARQLNPFLYDDPNRPFMARAEERAALIAQRFKAGTDYIANPANGHVWITRSPAVGAASDTSVVCLALQAAWLMGFREVRIYGMDLGGPARFYQEQGKVEPTRLDDYYESHLLPWFKAFAANFCGPDFRVFNCSDSSRLPADVLPRRDPNEP